MKRFLAPDNLIQIYYDGSKFLCNNDKEIKDVVDYLMSIKCPFEIIDYTIIPQATVTLVTSAYNTEYLIIEIPESEDAINYAREFGLEYEVEHAIYEEHLTPVQALQEWDLW